MEVSFLLPAVKLLLHFFVGFYIHKLLFEAMLFTAGHSSH